MREDENNQRVVTVMTNVREYGTDRVREGGVSSEDSADAGDRLRPPRCYVVALGAPQRR